MTSPTHLSENDYFKNDFRFETEGGSYLEEYSPLSGQKNEGWGGLVVAGPSLRLSSIRRRARLGEERTKAEKEKRRRKSPIYEEEKKRGGRTHQQPASRRGAIGSHPERSNYLGKSDSASIRSETSSLRPKVPRANLEKVPKPSEFGNTGQWWPLLMRSSGRRDWSKGRTKLVSASPLEPKFALTAARKGFSTMTRGGHAQQIQRT